jgi:hypothetical protein
MDARRIVPLRTRNGGEHVDTSLLIATGAIAGPYRRTRPVTLTWRMRVLRALRNLTRRIL